METNSSSFPETDSYGKYISAIYRHLQILIASRLAPFRIGSGQYIFLLTIAGREGISQKALSGELLIDKATTAKAVGKLEAEGYVRREASPDDNRYNMLYLTGAGRAVVPKVLEALHEVRSLSLAGIDDGEYRLMIYLLRKVLRNVSGMV